MREEKFPAVLFLAANGVMAIVSATCMDEMRNEHRMR